jgi:hypothetical protein
MPQKFELEGAIQPIPLISGLVDTNRVEVKYVEESIPLLSANELLEQGR